MSSFFFRFEEWVWAASADAQRAAPKTMATTMATILSRNMRIAPMTLSGERPARSPHWLTPEFYTVITLWRDGLRSGTLEPDDHVLPPILGTSNRSKLAQIARRS